MTPNTIKTGDTDVTFSDNIYRNGALFDLSGCHVAFWMRNVLGGASYSGSGTVAPGSGATSGEVSFTVDARFPNGIGAYYQEWSITTSDLTPLTFTYPEDGYNQVRILDKLA